MWPNDLGLGPQEVQEIDEIAAWRVLPSGFELLCERVAVDGASTMSPRVLLTHPQLEEQNQMVEMTVRLQGFVAEVNLGALGNWRL